jgi:phosphate starvation-inducible membrane PsiE
MEVLFFSSIYKRMGELFMKNNNMYLNEENYKKINSKIKNAGRLVMIIALILIVVGFIIKIGSMGVQVPSMGSENWFEMESYKSSMSFGGTGLIMFGVWLEFIGCIIRYFIGNRREIMAYSIQTTMPIAQEGIQTIAPTIAETGATVMKTMAPAYGEVAKNIAQGIKEGLDK